MNRITRGDHATVRGPIAAHYSPDDAVIPAGTTGRVIRATKKFCTIVTDEQRELTINTTFLVKIG